MLRYVQLYFEYIICFAWALLLHILIVFVALRVFNHTPTIVWYFPAHHTHRFNAFCAKEFQIKQKSKSSVSLAKLIGYTTIQPEAESIHALCSSFTPALLLHDPSASYIFNTDGSMGIPAEWILGYAPCCKIVLHCSVSNLSKKIIKNFIMLTRALSRYFSHATIHYHDTYFTIAIDDYPPLKSNMTIIDCIPEIIHALQSIKKQENHKTTDYFDIRWFSTNRHLVHKPLAEKNNIKKGKS